VVVRLSRPRFVSELQGHVVWHKHRSSGRACSQLPGP
jgi:hypothetical protein